MATEMAEAPGAVRRLLEDRHRLAEALQPVPRPLAGVVLLGRGSSEHAALYGRYLLEMATARPASLFPPSLAATTGTAGTYHGHLAVAVSQSGETGDVVAALQTLSRAGAVTLGLTARPDSPLGAAADIVVDLRTGTEKAVPATKTFVASLAALALIAETLGVVPWSPGDWERRIKSLHGLLADPGPAERAAVRLGRNDTVACVARNLLRPVAGEAALKLQEAALLQADAHSSISFHHGPVAAVGPDRPVIGFATAGPWGDDTRRLLHRVRLYGSQTILVDQSPDADIPLPSALPAGLLPLAAAVVAQQIALACAVRWGLDPDQPPGLTKVTRP
jgi:glucosamine--fructose-6-phosphate aminotransferase (isomerizing)